MSNAVSKSEVLEALRQSINEIELAGQSSKSQAHASGVARTKRANNANGKNDANNEAFKKIQRLLNCREHSTRSLHKRLVRGGFSESVANAAISRACECGLVSDARFAETLVSSRRSQGYGIGAIERELYDNNISPQSCPAFCEFAESSNSATETQRALEFLHKRPTRSKNPRQAAYRNLVQRGYSTYVASAAAKAWTQASKS